MSRWIISFQQHPFQAVWQRFQALLETVQNDDPTILTNVEELTRIKVVTAYIREIVETLDPEFVPATTWSNFHSQVQPAYDQLAAYQSNKNIAHLTAANDNIDNILSYVKPYNVLPAKALRPLRASLKALRAETDHIALTVSAEAAELLNALRVNRADMEEQAVAVTAMQARIHSFEKELFVAEDGHLSTEEAIRNAKIAAEKLKSEIEEFHAHAISNPDSLKTQLNVFEVTISLKQAEFEETLRTNKEKANRLAQFYKKIFGSTTADGSDDDAGLESELNARLEQMSRIESQQQPRYHALFQQIEGLLPGANSAGLASAYGDLATKFKEPIKSYTRVFYASLALLLVVAFMTSVKIDSTTPYFPFKFSEVSDWDVALRGLLSKIPFIGPLIWLAMFSSARRSQYERLQQEYAHKEALARSYESYKKELLAVGNDSEEMLKALMTKAIDTISYNASTTLDGKHNEPTPATRFFESLKKEDLEKLMGKFTDFLDNKNKAS